MRSMGVYNRIQCDVPCPICNSELNWLSKYLVYDGFVLENLLETIELRDTMHGEMYTSCKQCGTWLEAEIIDGKGRITVMTPKVDAA
jgi:hypothetical protein